MAGRVKERSRNARMHVPTPPIPPIQLHVTPSRIGVAAWVGGTPWRATLYYVNYKRWGNGRERCSMYTCI